VKNMEAQQEAKYGAGAGGAAEDAVVPEDATSDDASPAQADEDAGMPDLPGMSDLPKPKQSDVDADTDHELKIEAGMVPDDTNEKFQEQEDAASQQGEKTEQAKAASLCNGMLAKVKTLGKKNSALYKKALKQATDFCHTARELVAKETEKDQKALKAGMKEAKEAKSHADKLTKKQRIMQQEKAATEEEDKLNKKDADDLKNKKQAIINKNTKKIESLAYKSEQIEAKAGLAKAVARKKKLTEEMKNMSPEQKEAMDKKLKADTHVQAIMKNLRANRQQMALLDGTLADLDAMMLSVTLSSR